MSPGIFGPILGRPDVVNDRRLNVATVAPRLAAAVPITAQDARSDIGTPSSALVSAPHSAHLPAANKKRLPPTHSRSQALALWHWHSPSAIVTRSWRLHRRHHTGSFAARVSGRITWSVRLPHIGQTIRPSRTSSLPGSPNCVKRFRVPSVIFSYLPPKDIHNPKSEKSSYSIFRRLRTGSGRGSGSRYDIYV